MGFSSGILWILHVNINLLFYMVKLTHLFVWFFFVCFSAFMSPVDVCARRPDNHIWPTSEIKYLLVCFCFLTVKISEQCWKIVCSSLRFTDRVFSQSVNCTGCTHVVCLILHWKNRRQWWVCTKMSIKPENLSGKACWMCTNRIWFLCVSLHWVWWDVTTLPLP